MGTTDYSGHITTGGTSQQLMPPATDQEYVRIQNVSTGLLWFNDTGGSAVANTPGSYFIAPGCFYESPVGGATTAAIQIVGASSSQYFAAISITGTTAGATITDRSTTIGTTAVSVFAANPNRNGYRVQNISQHTIYYNEAVTAVYGGAGMLRLAPGAYVESETGAAPLGAISFIGNTSNIAISAGEW